jgi:hypothetical protein
VSRAFAALLALGFVGATLAPAFYSNPSAEDSYPFSTYPMFAHPMGKRAIVFAEGVARGETVRLVPELVANDEPMQAQRTLRAAAASGAVALRELCARIAERVAQREELSAIRRVRLVRGSFEPIAYFEKQRAPEHSEVLRECRVARRR